jgi:hypothetical protein
MVTVVRVAVSLLPLLSSADKVNRKSVLFFALI